VFEFILRRRRTALIGAGALVVACLLAAGGLALFGRPGTGTWVAAPPPAAPTPSAAPSQPAPEGPPPVAAPAPAGLKTIDYGPAPVGFAADPGAMSPTPLTEGLQVAAKVPAYDKPGGRAVAYLPPDILGVRLTVPIVAKDRTWVAVLVPSTNRRVAWLPPTGWTAVALRDQLIVERATHTLTWLRDGAKHKTWPVTLGMKVSPTPLGRTFIIGRSKLSGAVYAGTDVFALGAVPDDVNAVPAGLRGAHIGIHTWHNDKNLGKDTTDGCIRLTKSGQQELLAEVAPGTGVLVVDKLA
jgi:lipoprotein-anchoring transpeptidase ErfK/SrfK